MLRWSSGASLRQPRRLAPGQEDRLLLTVFTQGRQGPLSVGVRLQGRSGWRRVRDVLQVQMHVVPPLVVRPEYVSLADLRPGQKRTVRIELWGVAEVVRNAQARAEHDALHVVHLRWRRPGAAEPVPEALQEVSEVLRGELVLEIDADAADPEVATRVVLHGAGAKVALPEIPVWVRVVRPWRAYPPRVYVSARRLPLRRVVLVRFQRPQEAEAFSVAAPPGVHVRMVSLDERTLRVELNVERPLHQPAVVELRGRAAGAEVIPLELVPET